MTGSVTLKGEELVGRTTRHILDSGIGFVPEDRSHDGLVGKFSIAENMILDQYKQPPFAKGMGMKPKVIAANAEEKVEEFDVRTTGVQLPAGSLSGGNQQKVVLARELSKPVVSLFIASQPTRGVDVGAIEFVHKRVIAERDAGVAVLIVSTELDEVAALADRIAMMYRGKIIGIVPPDTPRGVLGLMMAGVPAGRRRAGRSRRRRRGGREVSDTDLRTEVTAPVPEPEQKTRRYWVDQVVLYALSFLLALVISAFLIAFANEDVRESAKYFFSAPMDTLTAAWTAGQRGVQGPVLRLGHQLQRLHRAGRAQAAHRDPVQRHAADPRRPRRSPCRSGRACSTSVPRAS